ncbi:MAG: filamentous hemagglutinin N-terminal domain-containing protein, partial [Candidatus Gastranaerophilales bacterium]|nr:filamentous hemagglutinin N-terminal domain-containing protein [Candidatus Gastranaerophilales bacterium]
MKKLLSTAAAIGVFASTSMLPALADVSATALPSLNSATNATVTTPTDTYMNVQITGGQGSVGTTNWNTYNIGKDAQVNYEFTAHNQTSLNKVLATGGISQIYGKITNSGCSGCGYADTGKVILINPNGVLFGSGANVNLNSFTVSTMDGTYDSDNNKLTLTKGSNQSDYGIVVQDGAEIYGDKNVAFASNNITLYEGSKISTSTTPNVTDDTNGEVAYGKIKLVTADGVNYTYYNNGAVSGISDITTSTDKMMISLNGDLTSGHIDVRNYSTNEDSELNLNKATLKAVQAVKGNDGNIWL